MVRSKALVLIFSLIFIGASCVESKKMGSVYYTSSDHLNEPLKDSLSTYLQPDSLNSYLFDSLSRANYLDSIMNISKLTDSLVKSEFQVTDIEFSDSVKNELENLLQPETSLDNTEIAIRNIQTDKALDSTLLSNLNFEYTHNLIIEDTSRLVFDNIEENNSTTVRDSILSVFNEKEAVLLDSITLKVIESNLEGFKNSDTAIVVSKVDTLEINEEFNIEIAKNQKNSDTTKQSAVVIVNPDSSKLTNSGYIQKQISFDSLNRSEISSHHKINNTQKTVVRELEIKTIRDTVYINNSELITKNEKRADTLQIQILFEINQSELDSKSISKLNQLLNDFEVGKISRIDLSGFTDNTGNASYNLKLSALRVNSVKNYLINKEIADKLIFTQYFGEKYALTKSKPSERKVTCIFYYNNN